MSSSSSMPPPNTSTDNMPSNILISSQSQVNTSDKTNPIKRKREHTLRSLKCVHFDKVVGSGTFGVVYKAIEKETGDHVALKKIKMERETQGFPITVSYVI